MELAFRREVVEQKPTRHPRLIGDVLDGNLLERPFGQHARPEVDELRSALRRVEPRSLYCVHAQ